MQLMQLTGLRASRQQQIGDKLQRETNTQQAQSISTKINIFFKKTLFFFLNYFEKNEGKKTIYISRPDCWVTTAHPPKRAGSTNNSNIKHDKGKAKKGQKKIREMVT